MGRLLNRLLTAFHRPPRRGSLDSVQSRILRENLRALLFSKESLAERRENAA